MPRVIELIVSKDGQTTVQTKGFSGGSCIGASKWLEQAIGNVTTYQKTAEFFETAKTEQHIQQ
jgi:hypothetical protein